MNLAEHAYRQYQWQRIRGITEAQNGRFNTGRLEDEANETVDEAYKANPDYLKVLEEMIDQYSVLVGGMGMVVEEGGLQYQQINDLLRKKMEINSQKYPVEAFRDRSPEDAIQFCRAMWVLTKK